MPAEDHAAIETLLRTAGGFAPPAPASADDGVARRIALYADLLRRAPDRPCARARLLIAEATGGVRALALGAPPLDGGRGADCALRLDDPEVSRRHCRLGADAAGAWIEDLGSANGTWLNDRPLSGRTELRDGDVIRLGRALAVFSWEA